MTVCSLALIFLTAAPEQEWQPPENPDPSVILNEAQADARAKKYEQALAKHIWYHRNALRIEPAQRGVRLSFALLYWKRLADNYPAALFKLMEIREEAAANVVANVDARQSFDHFNDFAAINRTLGEESRTSELFASLHKEQPEVAKRVFSLAQPALIKAKEYQLSGYYIDPARSYQRMLTSFESMKRLAKDPKFGERQLDFGKRRFTNDVTTLVALLVVNGRKTEAEKVVGEAQKEWDDKAFQEALQDALQGNVPTPWP